MRPYKLDLTQFGDKVRDEIEFNIMNVSDQPLDLSLISFDNRYFEVILPKSVNAGETGKGKVKLLKDVLDKKFEKSFTIEVNDAGKSRFTVPVKRDMRDIPNTNASTAKSTGH